MPRSRTGYVVDVQSRLLDDLATRVVIPLIPRHEAPAIRLKTVNPLFHIEGREYVLMTQNMATVLTNRMDDPVGTLASQRDHLVRAIDALLGGI
jgi:toxin CcdB